MVPDHCSKPDISFAGRFTVSAIMSEGKLAPGVPRRYTGGMDAYAKIVRQEGVATLWTGLGTNVARNAIINAAELWPVTIK